MKKIIGIILIVCLLFTNFISITYAFWNTIETIQPITINIGEWEQIFEWNSTIKYSIDDKVIWNGITYTSLKNHNSRRPGSNGSTKWWKPL